MKIDEERTSRAREAHEAGIKFLNALNGLEADELEAQRKFFAYRAWRKATPRKRGGRKAQVAA